MTRQPFLPSAHHVQDERQRPEWMRDDEGERAPCRGPIDLDSGIVRIRIGGSQGATRACRSGAPAWWRLARASR
ncbi:DUF6191 domain-containing protein [Streptomyces sp. NPDC002766]|uniref:DUF6191 domain-containing protein n=1 Tax=unclassified Streptomyces TaxID=2593676 RepID=UPI003316BDA0